ncbi:hypothetical protein LIER_39643 [Lithospermum erythrorhizon]|uniref:Retrotransposon gag domain-containing protein n=1 Tax=Lithospermum erythrorhizon TaxID=34254 RepID=A0AAV3QHZ2_LITER
MVVFLRAQKILGVVDRTLPCPDHPQFSTWVQCDDITLSWLTATLSTHVLETFLNHECNSSYEAWTLLQKLFLDHVSTTEMQLRYKFQHFKKGDLSMVEYLQQIHSLYCNLQAVGEPLKDSDLVAQTLLGLPSAFHAFKTIMNVQLVRPSFFAIGLYC